MGQDVRGRHPDMGGFRTSPQILLIVRFPEKSGMVLQMVQGDVYDGVSEHSGIRGGFRQDIVCSGSAGM